MMRSVCQAATLALVTVLIAGCGSNAGPQSSSASQPMASTASSTTPATTSDPSTTAAPSAGGPPSFTMTGTTENGDHVRVEGRFGPTLPASESDVDQAVLSECPGYDGREMVTRLDLTATLESSLSGTVVLYGFIPPISQVSHLVDYVLGYSEGPTCDLVNEESEISINFGTLQPHQPANFTMWVVLLDAITPNDPHPSEQTLAHQNWLMGAPEASVDGSAAKLTGAGPGILVTGG